MKRTIWLFMGLISLSLMIGAFTAFQGCAGDDPGTVYLSSSAGSTGTSSSSSSSGGGGAAGFGIFSDSIPLGIVWDTDAKLDVWSDYSAGMTIEKINAGTGEGAESWKYTGTGAWMGLGIRVNPITVYKDLSAYSSGSLRFMFKGTKIFKVGIKDGSAVEKWVSMADGSYGFVTNDTWCNVVIPLSAFSGINFASVQQYFMWVADSGLGYTVGSVYYIDNIYFATN